jgi:hypothetical protein
VGHISWLRHPGLSKKKEEEEEEEETLNTSLQN